MTPVLLIARRELAAYFRSYLGYVIIAAILLLCGLFFEAFALGAGAKKSSEVLHDFFYLASGHTIAAAILISMRVLAEERQVGTLPLLMSAPVSDAQIVLGKFLSAFGFLAVFICLTAYMPALIFVNGSVSLSTVAAGYLGLLLLGAASVAVGVFASAVAPNQVLAAIISTSILVALLIMWMLGSVTERPLNDAFSYLALWHKHFQPFMDGLVNARDILYYVTLTYVFLHLSTRVLQARRWR